MASQPQRYNPTVQPVDNWSNPTFNYHSLSDLAFSTGNPVVTPTPVLAVNLPTSVRGRLDALSLQHIPEWFDKFPSPLVLFNKPRNFFGA